MKKIYEFELTKEIETDEVETSKNEKGEEIKITKKVKKEVPFSYIIRKPTRSLNDEADLFFSQKLSEYTRRGVLTIAQLQRRLNDDGGILSTEQKSQYEKWYSSLLEKQNEYQVLNSKKEEERTADEKTKIDSLLSEMVDLMRQIQNFENSKNSLYSNTAENMARNQTTLFWTLMLSFQKIDENTYKPVFGEGLYEDRLKIYDQMEEKEDEFEYKLLKRLYLATSLWVFGKVSTQEEFDLSIKMFERGENDLLLSPEQDDKILEKNNEQREKT